ncbi:hypothetical protein GCM10016272_26620 [Psychrobacter glaciei]|uniref:Uncharacterized protein n=1 Tax=Psychrobacter glaciei TaxID=619771 RepID=A0ABQ3GWL7_9GAMM|nr:hypothetical protein GCM10016272_26620 [Psychrobacter glaciei]
MGDSTVFATSLTYSNYSAIKKVLRPHQLPLNLNISSLIKLLPLIKPSLRHICISQNIKS